MQSMTLSQALTIFELKSKYTEDELKKRYITLMKQYHPDRYERENQEIKEQMTKKTQDINEAYEILKKNLTNRQKYTHETASTYWSNQSYQGYGYNRYKKDVQYTKKIKKTQEKMREYFKSCSVKKLMNQVYDLINNYINQVEYSQNPDLTFINFKIELEKLYRNYIIIYAQKHNIPSFIIKQHNFNYDCDCSKLFNQIKDCERKIGYDLSKIIRKHKCHEHFDILEDKITEESKIIREKINFNTTTKEYSEILETYDNIVDKLIIDYSIKHYEFKFALSKISRQLTEEIKKELYKNIKSIVLNADYDEMTELLISAIEESKSKEDKNQKETIEQIETIENSKIPKEESKTDIKKLHKIRESVYNELKQKYLKASKTNIMEIEMINNLFTKAVELLYSKNCTLKIVQEINNLTFDNPQEEYEKLSIYDSIEHNQSEDIKEKSSYRH